MSRIRISDRWIGDSEPTYFIADIAANHDGDLSRAESLIQLAKEAGADAAKFQNFLGPKIVSRYGFESMGSQLGHQSAWEKPVDEIYQDASVPWEWTEKLSAVCNEMGIHYFSTPYDFGAVDMLDPFVPAYKIGSGDITWPEMLEKIANKRKPVILSTGAADITDVERSVKTILNINKELILLQCNTNYTAAKENLNFVQLNVLKTYAEMFPELVLGLSDHVPGFTSVLGAVALGGRVIEKHFTDDRNRQGPDHKFSEDPASWREMVDRTRELEAALGDGGKRVMDNEADTVVIQRRCLRAARPLAPGTVLTRDLIEVLRPAPHDSIFPYYLEQVIGKRTRTNFVEGEHLTWDKFE